MALCSTCRDAVSSSSEIVRWCDIKGPFGFKDGNDQIWANRNLRFPVSGRPPSSDDELGNKMFDKEAAKMVLNEGIGRRLLNVRETALYLGLEVDTIYKKARLRELPCVKVGRALRFDLKALERFVEQHTIETID